LYLGPEYFDFASLCNAPQYDSKLQVFTSSANAESFALIIATQNLTGSLDLFSVTQSNTESSNYYDTGVSSSSIVMEMASTVARLEESVKRIKGKDVDAEGAVKRTVFPKMKNSLPGGFVTYCLQKTSGVKCNDTRPLKWCHAFRKLALSDPQ